MTKVKAIKYPHQISTRHTPHHHRQDDTWEGIRQRLKPGSGARVMVNLGQSPVGPQKYPADAAATVEALRAMHRVFAGEVSVLHIGNMVRDVAVVVGREVFGRALQGRGGGGRVADVDGALNQ